MPRKLLPLITVAALAQFLAKIRRLLLKRLAAKTAFLPSGADCFIKAGIQGLRTRIFTYAMLV